MQLACLRTSLKILLTLEIGHCRVKFGWVTLVQPTDLELSLLVFRNPFFQFVRTRPSCAGPTGTIMDIPRFFEFYTFFGRIWTRNCVITTFIIGWWISIGSCFTYKRRIAWRTSSRANVSRAVVMHISYSSEWHLIDKLLRHLLHVNPATSATSYRQIKMFDQQTFLPIERATYLLLVTVGFPCLAGCKNSSLPSPSSRTSSAHVANALWKRIR